MKRLLMLPLLLLAVPAQAAVTCDNNVNPAVSETTPNAEFTDNGDGTVTHTKTGLMWMRCSLGQSWDLSTCNGTASTENWQAALQAAQDINSGASNDDYDSAAGFAGHTDWRLPNRKELRSIVEERCWSPAINAAPFPATPSGWFWSSSPSADYSNAAWGVYFVSGLVNAYAKGDGNYVRLVRAGQ